MATAPSGEAYASARQVATLEKLVFEQQAIIERLEQEKSLWSAGVQTFLQEQIGKAQGMRGSKGQDILTTASFMSVHLGEAIQSLQRSNEAFLKTALPLSKLQELEKRLLSRPVSNEEVAALIARIEHLENSKMNTHPQTESQPIQLHELETMKAHISHLEETLIQEVQRAYRTVHKPGDYGSPLGKLQAQVERLTQDIQTIKLTDGQQIVETFLTAGVANMRQEFQRGLDNRATVQQWETLQERLDMIEQFSRDVQIQVLRSQSQQNAFETRMSEQFSDERWSSAATKLTKLIENRQRETSIHIQEEIFIQKQLVSDTLNKTETTIGYLEREIRSQYGPEMLKSHIDSVRSQVLDYTDYKHTEHTEQISRKLSGFLDELQKSKQTFLELTSEVSNSLSAANLKERFHAFANLIAKNEETLTSFMKRADSIEVALERQSEQVNERNETLLQYKEFLNNSISNLEQNIRAEQQAVRASLDTWCENRKEILLGTFTKQETLLENLSTKVLAAEETLQITLEKRKEFEENIEKETAKKMDIVSKTVEDRLEQHENYLIGRVSELSTATKRLGETISEQRDKLEVLLSEQTLAEFVGEIESRVRVSQEDWTRRRTQMINSRLDEFHRVMEIMLDSSTATAERHEQILVSLETSLRKAQIEQTNRLLLQVTSEVDSLHRRVDQTLQAQTKICSDATNEVDTLRRRVDQNLQAQLKACSEATSTAANLQIAYQKQIADATLREKYSVFQNEVYTQLTRWMADWKAAAPLPSTIQSTKQNQQQFNTWISELKADGKLTSTIPSAKQNQQQLWYGAITKCFYTAIIGQPGSVHDTLGTCKQIPGWDYICFTNLDLPETEGWRIIKVAYSGEQPAVEAKRIKWLSHIMLSDYDVVIWMDAYLTPNPAYNLVLYNWIQHMRSENIVILHRTHGERICIWEECDAVLKSKRDTPEHVRSVQKLLRESKMPRDWGLFDTNIIIKFNKDVRVQDISEAIFKQCETVSPRDQLAVSYVYFLNDFKGYKAQHISNAFQITGNHIRLPAA
jgi:hypothetical protein